MTKKEKIIVSAHTGVLMCDFSDVHKYIEEKLGRPVFTHELADKAIQKEVEEKSREEFLEICRRARAESERGRWIKVSGKMAINCSACLHCSWSLSFEDLVRRFNFCPNCGADMRGENNG